MNKLKLFLIISLLASNLRVVSHSTEIVYLSGRDAANTVDWEFFCTDGRNSGKWTTIPVPSNWELQGFGTYNYGHDWRNKDLKLGKEHGLYKHRFEVPASWKGKTVNIVFDGAMTDTKVTINGKSAGEMHQGGFYRFKYDISKLLKYGQLNLLEVDVAKHSANESVNRAERQADYWIFGGIFRPVFLEVLSATHISRAAIDTRADGSFDVLVQLNNSKSNHTVTIELFELNGQTVGQPVVSEMENKLVKKTVSGKIENIKAWNPEWPHLYDMKITLKKGSDVLHQVTERIGFRTVELREHDGFYMNGEKVLFKGANRHSFWPETGRALSEEMMRVDIRLMQEMNMNAVRCSHYPPDKRFLELCDSLGLFVLNEVAGWQDGYDTIIGPKLIKETILRDENHPSVVVWDHGNEGGLNFASEKTFYKYDIQKRPVIYPWLLRNGVDTHHYPVYHYAIGRYAYGNHPFMPTEFLHGLYDGGHGAGLDDYWQNYQTSPLHAGGFLWVLVDEAVLRTDKPGKVYDGDGNHAPDGILDPHREKEGSFYTIKEIWSPVQVKPLTVNKKWNGKLFLENKFIYTNLNQCAFTWEAVQTGFANNPGKTIAGGKLQSPDCKPGETTEVWADCNSALQQADIFRLKATDPNGKELYTWSWPVIQPKEKAAELLILLKKDDSEISIKETGKTVLASVAGLEIEFSKENGTLVAVKNQKGRVSLSGGPVVTGTDSKVTETKWELLSDGSFCFQISTGNYPKKMTWTLSKSGLLKLEVAPLRERLNNIDFLGISFNYPEEKCTGVKWMGRGPYRVWKNRIKGSNIGVWEKAYNNTVTSESFGELEYPEFKGYHGNLYWAVLETSEKPITIVSGTANLYFQLFKPEKPKHMAGGTHPPFPDGDLSFLLEIPPIGTKFYQAADLGPGSQKGRYMERGGDQTKGIELWFDLRGK
jgi:hypothetical protein